QTSVLNRDRREVGNAPQQRAFGLKRSRPVLIASEMHRAEADSARHQRQQQAGLLAFKLPGAQITERLVRRIVDTVERLTSGADRLAQRSTVETGAMVARHRNFAVRLNGETQHIEAAAGYALH